MDASFVGTWLSLVEHYVRDVGVAGSNPVVPTNKAKHRYLVVFCFIDCVAMIRTSEESWFNGRPRRAEAAEQGPT